MQQFCGHVAILGKPNAGKSTLTNALVGYKIAGVSRRAQTTRNQILGVLTEDQYQCLFLDTPGLHSAKGKRINSIMNQEAWNAVRYADVIIYLVDCTSSISEHDHLFLSRIAQESDAKVFICLSKSDRMRNFMIKDVRKQLIEDLKEQDYYKNAEDRFQFICSTAKDPAEVKKLAALLFQNLPEREFLYEKDDITNRSTNFLISEYIREQIFRKFAREIPYGIGVLVEEYTDKEKIIVIKAKIIVNRPSHKGIVVGRQGQALKDIGQKSRETIEKQLGKKVYLELFVTVVEDWVDRPDLIQTFQGMEELN